MSETEPEDDGLDEISTAPIDASDDGLEIISLEWLTRDATPSDDEQK